MRKQMPEAGFGEVPFSSLTFRTHFLYSIFQNSVAVLFIWGSVGSPRSDGLGTHRPTGRAGGNQESLDKRCVGVSPSVLCLMLFTEPFTAFRP